MEIEKLKYISFYVGGLLPVNAPLEPTLTLPPEKTEEKDLEQLVPSC